METSFQKTLPGTFEWHLLKAQLIFTINASPWLLSKESTNKNRTFYRGFSDVCHGVENDLGKSVCTSNEFCELEFAVDNMHLNILRALQRMKGRFNSPNRKLSHVQCLHHNMSSAALTVGRRSFLISWARVWLKSLDTGFVFSRFPS